MPIPGGSFEQGLVVGQAGEPELALLRNHVAVEVFGGEFGPGLAELFRAGATLWIPR